MAFEKTIMSKKITSPRCLTMIAALMFLSMWLPASAVPFDSSHLSFALNDEGTGYIVSGHYEGVPKPSGSVIIPSEYNGLPVVKIGDMGFANWNKFTSLSLPNTITEIGYKAFEYCSAMTTITIEEGSGLKSIGENAFYGCKKLGELTLPGTVTTMGQLAFGNTGLVTVTLGEGIPGIPASAFNAATKLKNINFPESCTTIGDYAFAGCAIETLALPATMTSIGEGAFIGCSSLSSLDINVPAIGARAFEECTLMQTLRIGKDVASIGERAFVRCSGLTSITVDAANTAYDSRNDSNVLVDHLTNTIIAGCNNSVIPETVTAIGDYAFSYCTFDTFSVPVNVTAIGANAFRDCYNLKSLTIPEGIARIEDGTLYGCYSLTSFTIPESVTFIGTEAFYACSSLTNITLPEKVEGYGERAFESAGIVSITNRRATAVESDEDMFGYSTYTDATLTVPFGSRFSYYTTMPWSKFTKVKEGLGNVTLLAPVFSVEGGTYNENVELTITNPNEGGTIYYYTTVDRTVREYTVPIKLVSPFHGDVIAIVMKDDEISECASQYYDVEIPSLGVTVAGVQVNEKNKYNVLGDGTVRYDDKSGILYLTNAKIDCGKGASAGIEVEDGSLTIMLSGENRITGAYMGIFMMPQYSIGGTLTIAGSGSENDALVIDVADEWGDGIYVYLSNMKIENCRLVINGGSHGIMYKAGEGVIDGGLEIDNARVDVTAGESAVGGVFRFTLGEGLSILEPAGAEFVTCDGKGNFENIQIGGEVQKHVVIGKKGTGVEGIDAAQPAADGAIYDIHGRRLERITQPGFYIVGGQKVIVK